MKAEETYTNCSLVDLTRIYATRYDRHTKYVIKFTKESRVVIRSSTDSHWARFLGESHILCKDIRVYPIDTETFFSDNR